MTSAGLGGWKARVLVGVGLAALAAAGLLLATTRIAVEGRWRGLFLLKARDGRMLELQDDLFLGDGSRLVVGVSFSAARRWLGVEVPPPPPGQVALDLDWDERSGRGVVRNRLADGRELVTLLGRFEDDQGHHPQGLFVGGAVPDIASDFRNQDQSGMALQAGGRWYHIWCNTNEALVDRDVPGYRNVYPGELRFLGSRVLVHDSQRVVLESQHEATLSRGRLRMDRYAYFTAGEPFFKLGIRLTAVGPGPVTFAYLYGDEPWVGYFGTAEGNYGWLPGRIVRTEGHVDPAANRWAGVVDVKTGLANYLEWQGEDLPDQLYFANQAGRTSDAKLQVPLASNEIFIGLQWVRRRLAPGEGRSIRLIVGLADLDPATGLPARPSSADNP
ncbi:MAG: hypothetical protein NDI82_03345 [Anaeromyxobacteraceae bacterium]|nr:hypothetical protein [Anaeromyxobacteraceae bacterium]